MHSALRDLENDSIHVLREVAQRFSSPAILWSMGKDSTTLLWMARKAFFGQIPFPVIHIDTSYKFPEMYEFRDNLATEWGLDLRVHRNDVALANGMGAHVGRLQCCTALKTHALQAAVAEGAHDAILLGIRGDEHGVRAKERVFSPRDASSNWDYHDQPPAFWDVYQHAVPEGGHVRVHPILRWREVDIWDYVEAQEIPIPDLYRARDGLRYRSIGCACCCAPVVSNAQTVAEIARDVREAQTGERAGRAQDKEDAAAMQKLRALGYM